MYVKALCVHHRKEMTVCCCAVVSVSYLTIVLTTVQWRLKQDLAMCSFTKVCGELE